MTVPAAKLGLGKQVANARSGRQTEDYGNFFAKSYVSG